MQIAMIKRRLIVVRFFLELGWRKNYPDFTYDALIAFPSDSHLEADTLQVNPLAHQPAC